MQPRKWEIDGEVVDVRDIQPGQRALVAALIHSLLEPSDYIPDYALAGEDSRLSVYLTGNRLPWQGMTGRYPERTMKHRGWDARRAVYHRWLTVDEWAEVSSDPSGRHCGFAWGTVEEFLIDNMSQISSEDARGLYDSLLEQRLIPEYIRDYGKAPEQAELAPVGTVQGSLF
jgi:hypothetical protein